MSLEDRWRIEARRWLEDAFEDYAAAKDLTQTHHYALACFHCQQAAEKAVKAALYTVHFEARDHSVSRLLEELSLRAASKYPPSSTTTQGYSTGTTRPQDTQTSTQA